MDLEFSHGLIGFSDSESHKAAIKVSVRGRVSSEGSARERSASGLCGCKQVVGLKSSVPYWPLGRDILQFLAIWASPLEQLTIERAYRESLLTRLLVRRPSHCVQSITKGRGLHKVMNRRCESLGTNDS